MHFANTVSGGLTVVSKLYPDATNVFAYLRQVVCYLAVPGVAFVAKISPMVVLDLVSDNLSVLPCCVYGRAEGSPDDRYGAECLSDDGGIEERLSSVVLQHRDPDSQQDGANQA